MAAIVVFNSLKRVSLENEHAVRKMALGSNWTRLRLGVLCRINHASPGDITGGQEFCAGFSAGGAAALGKQTPGHVWGVQTVNSTWTHFATEDRWQTGSGMFRAENSAHDGFQIQGNSLRGALTGYVNYLCGWFFEAEKSGSDLIVRAAVPEHGSAAEGANANMTQTSFMNLLQGDPLTTAASNSPNDFETFSSTENGFDEATFGVLDSVNLYFGLAGMKLEIDQVATAKFA